MDDIQETIETVQEFAGIQSEIKNITENDISYFIKEQIRKKFYFKYPDSNFDKCWTEYLEISPFPALGNIYDIREEGIDKETHYIMRLVAAWHIEQALKALKFDTTNDDNLKEDNENGNIGTAGRIAKVWAGNNLDPENIREYGDGRFTKMPRLTTFPVNEKTKKNPVTISIENTGIGSVCSHHFLPYSITNDSKSKIVISYIPKNKLIGLSKIGRFVEWCLNRPSLQEEVTTLIHDKISEITETDDIYVGLFNIVHTCEITRGAKQYSTTTTEDYSGIYNEPEIRNTILNEVK